MPLRDHFRPPFNEVASWEEVHGQWPAVIVQELGPKLPAHFAARPRVHIGSRIEVDVATFDNEPLAHSAPDDESGGVATAVWAPAEPTLAVETALSDFDEYEIRVYNTRRGRELVAAIAVTIGAIAPANNRAVASCACAALTQ